MTLKRFIIPGLGSVSVDLSKPNALPCVSYEDGTICKGLERNAFESALIGCNRAEIVKCNFQHECAHLFISWKCGIVKQSVAYLTGNGERWETIETIKRASCEERLVLGFQIFLNDVIGDWASGAKVGGFSLHIVAAALDYAKTEFCKRGFTLDGLACEFAALIRESETANRLQDWHLVDAVNGYRVWSKFDAFAARNFYAVTLDWFEPLPTDNVYLSQESALTAAGYNRLLKDG